MKKIIYVCVLTIGILSSCWQKRKHMYHFTPGDSICFNIYDTLKCYEFITNHGIDTLIINQKETIEKYDEWYFDMVEGSIFNAYFYWEGVLIHNGYKEDVFVSYKKIADNKDPLMCIILAERYAMDIDDKRNILKHGVYRDTIIVDSANSRQNKHFNHDFTFKNLKWHKYEGIVEYELSDGTIYKK